MQPHESVPPKRKHAPMQHLLTPAKSAARPSKSNRSMISLDQEFSLLKLVLKDASRVVYRWDFTHGEMHWSDNVGQVMPFLGGREVTKEEDWIRLTQSEDRKLLGELRHAQFEPGKEFSIEYFLTADNGDAFHIRQVGTFVRDEEHGCDLSIGMIDCSRVAKPTDHLHVPSYPRAESEYAYPASFMKILNKTIEENLRSKNVGELMIVFIKNLSMIINAYSHDTAETVMNELAKVIAGTLPKDAVIERIHRDQFGVILPRCTKDEALHLASKLNISIQNYGSSASFGSLHVTCNIGSVEVPSLAQTANDAMNKAYIALHNTHGIIYRTFDDTMDESAQSRQQMGLANYLCRAIQEKRLKLAYQPIIESKTGKISHYEALLRLVGDDGKISSAGALIPIAERMGLIDMIDQLVLDMVVKELLACPDVTLAFNVSNLTTENARWLNHFTNVMEQYPEIASRTIVEITETAAQRDLRQTAYFVASIQATGCQVALDDFGSGYTSFRQLKALSVDMVKIDGAFIKDLVDNADNRFFVKTLLDFTNGFGLKAVAEFVENGETAKMLMELGVEYMQGYYFGKPENVRSWLSRDEYEKE